MCFVVRLRNVKKKTLFFLNLTLLKHNRMTYFRANEPRVTAD